MRPIIFPIRPPHPLNQVLLRQQTDALFQAFLDRPKLQVVQPRGQRLCQLIAQGLTHYTFGTRKVLWEFERQRVMEPPCVDADQGSLAPSDELIATPGLNRDRIRIMFACVRIGYQSSTEQRPKLSLERSNELDPPAIDLLGEIRLDIRGLPNTGLKEYNSIDVAVGLMFKFRE